MHAHPIYLITFRKINLSWIFKKLTYRVFFFGIHSASLGAWYFLLGSIFSINYILRTTTLNLLAIPPWTDDNSGLLLQNTFNWKVIARTINLWGAQEAKCPRSCATAAAPIPYAYCRDPCCSNLFRDEWRKIKWLILILFVCLTKCHLVRQAFLPSQHP